MKLKMTAALLLVIGVGVLAADWDGQFSFYEPVEAEQDPMIEELNNLPDDEFPEIYDFVAAPTTTVTATSDMDCKWDSDTVCCAFHTDAKFCICCSTLKPVQVGCRCVPLEAN